MNYIPSPHNQPLKLMRFARDGETLYKIYDYGDEWAAMTHSGGRTTERIYSKWRSDIAGSLARAEQATAPGVEWTSV